MENFDPTARKFLFRCCSCETIVELADFSNEEEIVKVIDGEIDLECQCGGISKILLD